MGVGEKLKRCRKVLLLRVWGEPGSKASEQSGKHTAQQTLGPATYSHPQHFRAAALPPVRQAAAGWLHVLRESPVGWEALAQQ